MSSGSASYSVSATNYGAKATDAYYILSAPDEINGPLHITGNLTVDGTSQLTGAVTCGASLATVGTVTVGGGLAVSGNVLLGSGPGGVVNLVPSNGSVNMLVGGGALVIGDNTLTTTSISLNGPVECKQLAVVGATTCGATLATVGNVTVGGGLTVANNVVATGSVGASAIGATTGSIVSLTVGGGATAPVNSLLANFPAYLQAGIANMGTGLIYPSSGTNNQTGSIVFGNLLINWGQGSSDADGIFAASFTVPYPVHGPGGDPGKDPMVFCATYNFDNGYQVYGTVLQRTRTGVRIQGQSPTTGTHVGAGFSLGYLAIGPVV